MPDAELPAPACSTVKPTGGGDIPPPSIPEKQSVAKKPELPRFWHELRQKVRDHKEVTFTLACPTGFTNENCEVLAQVVFVDSRGKGLDIKIRLDDGTETWLNWQAFGVSVEF